MNEVFVIPVWLPLMTVRDSIFSPVFVTVFVYLHCEQNAEILVHIVFVFICFSLWRVNNNVIVLCICSASVFLAVLASRWMFDCIPVPPELQIKKINSSPHSVIDSNLCYLADS